MLMTRFTPRDVWFSEHGRRRFCDWDFAAAPPTQQELDEAKSDFDAEHERRLRVFLARLELGKLVGGLLLLIGFLIPFVLSLLDMELKTQVAGMAHPSIVLIYGGLLVGGVSLVAIGAALVVEIITLPLPGLIYTVLDGFSESNFDAASAHVFVRVEAVAKNNPKIAAYVRDVLSQPRELCLAEVAAILKEEKTEAQVAMEKATALGLLAKQRLATI